MKLEQGNKVSFSNVAIIIKLALMCQKSLVNDLLMKSKHGENKEVNVVVYQMQKKSDAILHLAIKLSINYIYMTNNVENIVLIEMVA